MDSIVRTPDWAFPETLPVGPGVKSTASLVICDPASLCAEAIGAVVLKRTQWQVACVTTRMDVALVAAVACRARAVLFDVRDCSPRAVSELVHRIRSASREIAPVLLTGHDGARVIRSAIAAGVRACVHKSDSASVLADALHAVGESGTYVSAAFQSATARSRNPARNEGSLIRARPPASTRLRSIGAGHAHDLR